MNRRQFLGAGAAAPMLHFASVVPNLGAHREHREAKEARGGVVKVPTGPGLGRPVEAKDLEKAEVL